MLNYRLAGFVLALVGITACSGDDERISSDSAPINRTFVQFSPATGQLPVPSDLQFAAEASLDGTMHLDGSSANPVITGINASDGNSVLSPFDITFTGDLNVAQKVDANNFVPYGELVIPNPEQNVFLLPLAYPSGDAVFQANIAGASVEVPTFAEAAAYASGDLSTIASLAIPAARAELLDIDGGSNNVLRINPLRPLMPKTKYLVVITQLEDIRGNKVYPSTAYNTYKDPATDLGQFGPEGSDSVARLEGLRAAIQGWERLAAGYFGFMQSTYDALGVEATAPSAEDIIFSMTFTTGSTTDVLKYVAAPEAYYSEQNSSAYKKDAIVKLVSGQYTLAGTTTSTDPIDVGIASTINALLTTAPTDSAPNPLYNPSIAGAIAGGADFATVAANASAAYVMQRAAAEAALIVHNSDGESIAEEAVRMVQEAAGADPVSETFPSPASRTTTFYRQDALSSLNPLLVAPSTLYQGEITLPYYLTPPTETDLSPFVNSSWAADTAISGLTPRSSMITHRFPFPAKNADITVPLIAVTPDETVLGAFGVTRPEAGWPVIVFVHGITADRSTVLPMANALAFACIERDAEGNPVGTIPGVPCFATVAIDQPGHGVAPAAGPEVDGVKLEGSLVPAIRSVNDPDAPIVANIADNTPSANLTERHFNITADASQAPIPMDYSANIGSSGSLFVNLSNFMNSRDSMRQMSVDLLNLNASIDDMDLNGDGTANELDPSQVYFIGHSLGAIDGLPFVAVNNSALVQNSPFSEQPKVIAAAGLVTGGGLVRLLTNSPSFAPTIMQGLAAASDDLVQGKSALETYINVFQGVLDQIDVTNFASYLSKANSDTGILLTEVAGDNPDQTIPNSADSLWGGEPLQLTVADSGLVIDAFPAPLAGTEPMIAQFGAIPTAEAPAAKDGDPEVIVTRFTAGSHGTAVTADDPAAFAEMLSQIVMFFANGGDLAGSIVTNTDIVEEL